MRSCKLILTLIIGILMVACSKDNEQYPNPPLGKIRGKLVFEEFDFYDYDIGNSKYGLKVLDAFGAYTIPSFPMLNRLSPVWSSEGDAIWYLHCTNYVSFSGYNDVSVSRILDNGSQDTSLLLSNSFGDGVYVEITFSPDRKYLALNKGSKLELYEVVDKLQLKLLKSVNGGGGYFYFSWSPDSKKIIYSTRSWPNNWDVHLYNLESNEIENLLPRESSGGKISWSYSSDRIAFISGDDIFVIDVDGTNLINLTNTPGVEEQSPAFSPVGDLMIYASMDSLDQVILLDLTSGLKEVIISGQEGVSYFNNNDYNTFTWSKDGSEFLFRYFKSNHSGLRRFNFDRHRIETIYEGSINRFDWYEAP